MYDAGVTFPVSRAVSTPPGPPPSRPSTRDALVQATRAAIAEGGLTSVTAREITGRAAANLAAIGYHFGSKDALVTEALIAEVSELVEPVLDLLDSAGPPEELAADAVAALNELLTTTSARIPVYLAALSCTPHDAEVRSRLASLWARVRGRLAANIERQAEAGLLPAWIEPAAMAALILAVAQGVVVSTAWSQDDSTAPDSSAVAGQFLGLLLAARTSR